MSFLYLDCSMGAAGDMLSAALADLFEDKEKIVEELNRLGIPHTRYVLEKAEKCGIQGLKMHVYVDGQEEAKQLEKHNHVHKEEHSREQHAHEHAHHGHVHIHHHEHTHGFHLQSIEEIVSHLNLSEKVKSDVLAVYKLIAQAESRVHGKPVEHIHFHEVGTLDAIADVCAVCYLIERIHPEKILSSPVHVGSGTVHCAHGILPVPAPATALLLEGIPIYQKDIRSELCTPTGAACLKYFVDSFEEMPLMKIEKSGVGCGNKDFKQANILRIFQAESDQTSQEVSLLECTIDDMSGEAIGYAFEKLLEAGALEVYTVPVSMKKSRPGILLGVLSRREDQERMIAEIFKHTSTIGLRITHPQRAVLKRRFVEKMTEFGPVHFKESSGYGIRRCKAEFEDLKKIAKEKGLPIQEIIEKI